MSERFEPSQKSRLRRLHQRGSHDKDVLYPILDAGLVAHVGYVIDGQPYVTPTAYWREGDHVYWHGSSAARSLRAIQKGIAVCLTVTHLDGLVMARCGFNHSMNYRSAMLFGTAEFVTDQAEKLRALDSFVERVAPGRLASLRANDPQEVKATAVLRMTIDEASAKIRTGPPKDDEADLAVPAWAGVIPIRLVVDAPVADPRLAEGFAAPAHIERLAGAGTLDQAMLQAAAELYPVAAG